MQSTGDKMTNFFQITLCFLYLLVSVIAGQVLHDVPTFGTTLPGGGQKIVAATVVYAPLFVYILMQLVFRKRSGEYERTLFDRAAARAIEFTLLFALTLELVHHFVPSVTPARLEILPSLALMMFVVTRKILIKKGLRDRS